MQSEMIPKKLLVISATIGGGAKAMGSLLLWDNVPQRDNRSGVLRESGVVVQIPMIRTQRTEGQGRRSNASAMADTTALRLIR